MLSLTVKVLFSYSHFQKSRENPYSDLFSRTGKLAERAKIVTVTAIGNPCNVVVVARVIHDLVKSFK